jgi:hypothetical protein
LPHPYDFSRINLDWPAGGWIYYVSPNVLKGYTVCKVAVADSASKKGLFDYAKFRFGTFSISIDQTRAVIASGICTDDKGGGDIADWCIMLHAFPPSSEPVRDGLTPDCYSGCMGSMLTSGKYYVHYFGPAHDKSRVNSWALPPQCLSGETVTCVDIATMMGTTVQNIGDGLDGLLGSTNSDKWVCLEGLHFRCGALFMLANWVDKKAIELSGYNLVAVTSDTAIQTNECPGDFWVGGGPEGCYQTAEGTWVPLPGITVNSIIPLPQRSMPGAYVRQSMMASPAGSVTLYDAFGKKIAGDWGAAMWRTMPAGVYYIAVQNGSLELVRRVAVSKEGGTL